MFYDFLRPWISLTALLVFCYSPSKSGDKLFGGELLAGTGKVDITNYEAGPVNDPLFAKALVIKSDTASLVIVTLDAVAIGEIGHVKNDYLGQVRERLRAKHNIAPENFIVNASHCHGVVRADVAECTIQAVEVALSTMVPVTVGVGMGHEDRIMENRRLKLKSGKIADVRHAYSLPPDEEVVGVGPVDPQIAVVRLNRANGQPLAILYNFACHPIQGVPSGGNTADIIGFASKAIEENCGEGSMALFLQGCGGDINPIFYKDVDHPRSAEPLGNMLGLSTLRTAHKIRCQPDSRLTVINHTIELPRGDRTERILALEAEQKRLLQSLQGTSLNLKTFLPLIVKHKLADDFPAYYSHRYLHDEHLGHDDLKRLDTDNRRNLQQYIRNINTMEELTRVQTNLTLLRKHQATFMADGKRTVSVELTAIRLGDWVLTTFPGELTVQIGLNIKQRSPHKLTSVAGYTNGYIYYAPTTEQLLNPGSAQEDCDCILAPHWQSIYEDHVKQLLDRL